MSFSSSNADRSNDKVGLAICKGAWLGRPDEAWKHKCARWLACPSCERKRAGKRAHEIKERLKVAKHYFGNDMTVGVLTVTLPGQKHESGIRFKSLKEQYDYAVDRTTLPGLTGWHSMRGMNRLLCGKHKKQDIRIMDWVLMEELIFLSLRTTTTRVGGMCICTVYFSDPRN